MNNLSISYWENKYDCPNEADKEAIREAFNSGKSYFSFNFEQKVELAKVLLSAYSYFGSMQEYEKVFDICSSFNSKFAIEPLFYMDLGISISVWKYDYRDYISCIPTDVASEAIRQIYNRVGYSVDENDIKKIISSSNIYTLFLKNLKEEVNGRYIKVDLEEDHNQYIDGSFLNCYLLFDKLGLFGQDFFHIMARIGAITKSLREYNFEILSTEMKEIIAEAKDRSRNRMYPTWYEENVVVNL